MKTIEQAQAQGYTIDSSAAGRPWAYKGPRFNTTDAFPVHTDLEAEMLALLRRLDDVVEALDGTSVENEKLVDDYRALMVRMEGVKR